MGFFKEFKDDLSQAVNELLPEEAFDDGAEVNTLKDGAEDTGTAQAEDKLTEAGETEADEDKMPETEADEKPADEDDNDNVDMDILDDILTGEENGEEESWAEENADLNETSAGKSEKEDNSNEPPKFTSDEVSVITKSTVITGNINSEGSLEVMGTIKGDVECQGKLSIVGLVTGNCMAAEVYVGAKRFEGCINSEGSIKIGLGTVVIGDVTGTSGVIAGAVKGDIDISGPIIIDSSAVIKGNIKAQSIQINNGAVIEGFCSLSYASIDIDNIFE